MKTIRFNDSLAEKRASIYFMDKNTFGEYYWAELVTVCESKTLRSWRVTVYGRQPYGQKQSPLIQRTWLLKDRFLLSKDFNFSHVANTALNMAHKTRIHFYGTCLVGKWRYSGVPKIIARGVSDKLNRKYGRGWLYTNEMAQIEASRWLYKAKKVSGR